MMDFIFFYLPFLETIRDFFELGGPVLKVIALLTLFMWILIIERLLYFRTSHPGPQGPGGMERAQGSFLVEGPRNPHAHDFAGILAG